MTKKKESLTVQADLSDIFTVDQTKREHRTGFPIEKALAGIIRQMKAAGLRERTISDYEIYVNDFIEKTGVKVLREITADHVYAWLASMNVSNQTKLTRLKCLKAFFSRCFDNGWFESKFWNSIRIKVDNPVKEGATDREIQILLSMLDLTDFVQLRDAAAILLMYQTGIRVGTLARLENKHVNFESNLLKIDGGIIKNHESIYLPFDDVLARLLNALIRQNDLIRRDNRVKNELLFITSRGMTVLSSPSNNIITKRLNKYAKEFGLKNINPHALRRGFAKNLLNKGANIALISKALGHSGLAVTTRYLHLDKDEVAESLRKFL
ncbi:site-specific integrase [Caldifermentibacillus hisashii]|uniref:tyrosine-type recombinase/integrase n=1 Tax=Caldifermentibacillus hisashii TaxID=996558 RepID=UPI002E1AD2EE|nr:site-specific integrase [Caldifermentibacillus hisashii]